MAKIKISFKEFLIYQKQIKKNERLPIIIRWIFLLLYIFAIFEAIINKHYIFAIILIVIYILIKFTNFDKFGKKYFKYFYDNNKLLNSNFEITLSERLIKIKSGLNQLNYAVYDIANITKYEEFYYFEHFTGFKLILPKKPLSKKEISIIEKYMRKTEEKGKKYFSYITGKFK